MGGARLEGRVALVTGAGNGVGKECARLIAAHGARVVVNDRGTDMEGRGKNSADADRTVEEIEGDGGTAVANYDSVAEFDGAGGAVETALSRFGRIDICVNCAGAAIDGTIFDMPVEEYERTIALQMSQKFYIGRHAVPRMVEQGWGRVVNTTSNGAMGFLGKPAFAAAMGGVISMTKAMAVETQGSGVTVNCIGPGAATRLHRKSESTFKRLYEQGVIGEDGWNAYVTTPPPEYVAPIVAWLVSDAAAGVTGQVFTAKGGYVSIWNEYREQRVLYRGDHREIDPWSLDELDRLVPDVLLD